MKLTVEPASTDLFYKVLFQEPILDHVKIETLPTIMSRIAKVFGLRLNNIKINNEAPSDNFIHFASFSGPSAFDVSFGLEEVSARLVSPISEEQVLDLYGKLAQFFEGDPLTSQIMNIQQQLSTDGDVAAFFEELNPIVPNGFEESLDGRGVIYKLKEAEHELDVHITLAPSIILQNGVFMFMEYGFSPNPYNLQDALKIVKAHRENVFKVLNLEMKAEE